MGGRAGEEATIGDKSTGASNDFEQATAIAHSMVVNYGMTDSLGMVELEKKAKPILTDSSHTVKQLLLRLMKLSRRSWMKLMLRP
jgi:ATP-dependent Zn proteases